MCIVILVVEYIGAPLSCNQVRVLATVDIPEPEIKSSGTADNELIVGLSLNASISALPTIQLALVLLVSLQIYISN